MCTAINKQRKYITQITKQEQEQAQAQRTNDNLEVDFVDGLRPTTSGTGSSQPGSSNDPHYSNQGNQGECVECGVQQQPQQQSYPTTTTTTNSGSQTFNAFQFNFNCVTVRNKNVQAAVIVAAQVQLEAEAQAQINGPIIDIKKQD